MSERIKAGKGTSGYPVFTSADGEALKAHRATWSGKGIAVAYVVAVDGESYTLTAKGIGSKMRANRLILAAVKAWRNGIADKSARPVVKSATMILNQSSAPKAARNVAGLGALDAFAALAAGTPLANTLTL